MNLSQIEYQILCRSKGGAVANAGGKVGGLKVWPLDGGGIGKESRGC